MQLTNSEEEMKRATGHNIMRFGRTAGHNIMRFGRAGHNIMHFGKRDPDSAAQELSQETQGAYSAQEYPDSEAIGVMPQLYVKRHTSYGPRLLIPHLFLSSLMTPYRRFNSIKKADRDNVFMHFG